ANFARRVAGPASPVIDRLGEIAVPALVIVGEKDDAYLRAADVLSARLPRAERRTIPGAGHIVNLDAPEAFDAEGVAFLNQWAGGPKPNGRPRVRPGSEARLRDRDDDVRLMLAFAAGDEAAFAALFERWSRPLLRYLERLVREAATAEELVQEAFVRVHRARQSYRPEARFSTWLFRIATHLAWNELRRPRRRP